MTTTPDAPRLAVKVRRQVWVETDHPRDRKGRFIETGAEVRVWGGIVGRVLANVGGGRIEIVAADGRHVIVHRNYLTVISRPDGSAPTDKRDAYPTALRETTATDDAEEISTPDTKPDVDADASSANLYDLLKKAGDDDTAVLVRQAANDYVAALDNGVPDDEADERDGLLGVLSDVQDMVKAGMWGDNDGSWTEAIALLTDAAEAEPPAQGATYQPTTHRVSRAVARVADEHAEFAADDDRDPGYTVDGQVVTVTDPAAATATLREAQAEQNQIADALSGGGPRESRARATAELVGELVGELDTDAKPVYDGGNERSADEREAGTDGGAPLEDAPAGAVRDPDGSDGVLPGPRGGSGDSDRVDGGEPRGTDAAGGDLRGDVEPTGASPVQRGSGRGEGDPAPSAAPRAGDGVAGGSATGAGADGLPDSSRGVSGDDGRGEGSSDAGVAFERGDEVFWANPDPDDFITTRRGTFSHYSGADGSAYFDYERPLTATEKRRGVRRAPRQRQMADVADLYRADPLNPSPAEIEWRTRNEPGYEAPAAVVSADDVAATVARLTGDDDRAAQIRGMSESGLLDMVRSTNFTQSDRLAAQAELDRRQDDAADEAGFTRTYGRLDGAYGTVRTTNGGEVTGRISTAGATYPLDVEQDDGRFTGITGSRVAGIRLHDREDAGAESERLATTDPADLSEAEQLERIARSFEADGEQERADAVRARIGADNSDIPNLDAADEPDASSMDGDDPARIEFEEDRATEGDRQRGFNAGQDAAHDGTFDAHEDEPEAFRQGYAEGHASVTDDDVTVTADDLAATLANLNDDVAEIDAADAEEQDAIYAADAEDREARRIADNMELYGTPEIPTDADLEAEEPLPELPEHFMELESGTRIMVGWEENAHAATFLRAERSPYGNVVHYRDDNGTEQTFVPTPGEKPRPAPRNRAVENMVADILGTEYTTVDPNTGATLSLLGPTVGTWRTTADPTADEGVIKIKGDYGIAGEMRATIGGWVGWLGDNPNDEGNPTVTDRNPQAVLDRLYNGVNGDGAADRTRAEVTAGRDPAPEVGRAYTDLDEGARIQITPASNEYDYDTGGYVLKPTGDPAVDVTFVNYRSQSWTNNAWVDYRRDDREYGPGQFDTVAVAKDAAPVAAAPLLGTEAPVVIDSDGSDDGYEPDPYAVPVLDRDAPRFAPTGLADFAPAGQMAKVDANIEALRVLRTLRTEGRPATPDEQTILARWAGWGGVAGVFDTDKPEFAARLAQIEELLDYTELNRAKRTTVNAHYTDPRVVEQVWGTVRALGFDGGRVLEPGSGSGTFIGYRPENTDMVGVEWDSTTAAISKYLYPDADIRAESFANTNAPDGAFDATIGNVPFGQNALTDVRHNPDGHSIHNHFIIKSLAMTRPGGVVAVMTSRYTLDSLDSKAREAIYEQADLVGAVRFPNGSHKRIAGTDVIEDLVIFRKRLPGEEPGDKSWINSEKRDVNGWEVGVNDYFINRPDRVLGTLTARRGQWGGEVAVEGDVDTPDLPTVLASVVEEAQENGLTVTERTDELPVLLRGLDRYEGHIKREDDGTYTIATSGAAEPFTVPGKKDAIAEFDSMLRIRDSLMALLDAETRDDPRMDDLRAVLNTEYDAYVAAYGPLNRFTFTKNGSRKRAPIPRLFVTNDPKGAVINALEAYEPPDRTVPGDVGRASKATIFTTRGVAPREARTTADGPQDALTLSMDQFGRVNMPAIANMLDTDEDDAREQLGTLVFEDPPLSDDEVLAAEQAAQALREDPEAAHLSDLGIGVESLREPGNLIPSAEYLSGNVRKKLAAARAAAEQDPKYRANVEALAAVIPDDLGADEIDAGLGASWIDAATVEQFANYMLRIQSWEADNKKVQVVHSGGSLWRVEGAGKGSADARTREWGTDSKQFHSLLQSLLEQRPITVTVKGKQDPDATLAAREKAEAIQERFREWIWEDADRTRRLTARYNDLFNNLALRKYDGSGRSFDGMSEEWREKVQSHVKDGVERIVNEPTALLAHVVGAGKTATMVLGTGELKRLGLARKPAIIVPNHMLEQFNREYLEIYPNARILTAGQGMSAEERRTFVGQAAVGDWDAVIMTQGAFEGIPMGAGQMEQYIDREMATMRTQLEIMKAEAGESKGGKRTIKAMENALISAEEALRKRLAKVKDLGVSFDQTGIDYLMVDEAHEYSNLRTLSNIQGAGATGANMATDLHMKLEYIRANSRTGRVATFATGTPIRNTITQAYVMQKYLRPDLLTEAGIHTFDQWAATFGQVVEEMELKPEGKGFRSTQRFSSFRNVPEFLRMFHTFADVKMAEDLNLPRPNLAGGQAQVISVPASDDLKGYINWLGDRADNVRSGRVDPTEDNMLKVSTDGRKAALSMALVTDSEGQRYNHEPGKLEKAADQIASIYDRTKDNVYTDPKSGEPDELPGALQVVFMDMGTPKDAKGKDDEASVDDNDADFVAYDHMKAELVARGIPEDKIRYMHEAKDDVQKAEMFAAARAGRIAVLLGSSSKMGVGTNMQRRMKALHHVDAPWRPSDVEQRDGRGLRQGNLHMNMGEDFEIYRYVTEGSFDAYMWQTLERKAKFINQVMRGSLDVREIEDVGDTALSYAEIKAIAVGNPDFLTLAKGETLIAKLQRLQRTHAKTQTNMRKEITRLTEQAEILERNGVAFTRAAAQVEIPTTEEGAEIFRLNVEGNEFGNRTEAGDAIRVRLNEIMTEGGRWDNPEVPIGTYNGVTLTAQVRSDGYGDRLVVMRIAGVPHEFAKFRRSDLKEGQGTALGIVSRADNYLGSLESRRDTVLTKAAENRVEVARMNDRIGQAFKRDGELEAWTKKVERLRKKIERDDKRAEGAPIEFDPYIDSDQYDDPSTRGSAETYVAPPEQAPARLTVLADAIMVGDSVEIVVAEMSGTTGVGRVVSKREAGGMIFLTIDIGGTEYVRAFPLGTDVVKAGSEDAAAGVKGLVFVRALEVKDGRVVVEVKRRSVWRESLHPRDRAGRFIETGAEVRIWGGASGTIVGVAGGGRVKVKRSDGVTVVVDSGNVTVTKTPQGAQVGDGDDAAAPAAPAAAEAPAPEGAPEAPEAPDAAGSGQTPAPDAEPGESDPVFTAESGARAWLDTSGPEPVGYAQTDPDDPSTTVRYDDANAWAADVDAEGMSEDADGGTAASEQRMAADDAGATWADTDDIASMSRSDIEDALDVTEDPARRDALAGDLDRRNAEDAAQRTEAGETDPRPIANALNGSDQPEHAKAVTVATSAFERAQNNGDAEAIDRATTELNDVLDAIVADNPDGEIPDAVEKFRANMTADADGGSVEPIGSRDADRAPGERLVPAEVVAGQTGAEAPDPEALVDPDSSESILSQIGGSTSTPTTAEPRPDAAGLAKIGETVDALVESVGKIQVDDDDDTDLPGELVAAAATYDEAMQSDDPRVRADAFLGLSKALSSLNDVLDNGGTEPERKDALDDFATAVALFDGNVSTLFPPAAAGGTDPGPEGKVVPASVAADFLSNAGANDLTDGGSAAAHLFKGDDGQYRLTVERQALHDAIVGSIIDGVPVSDDPTYNFFGGGPASGKGSITSMFPHLEEDTAYINPDDVKFILPEMQPRARANDPSASSFVHEESSYLAKVAQASAFDKGINVTLDGTGNSSAESVRKKLAGARAKGYSVDAYYVSVPIDVAQERAVQRALHGTGSNRGRAVPPSIIKHTHMSVSAVVPDVVDDFDSFYLFDTNVKRPTPPNLLARKERGERMKVMLEEGWQEFLDKARYAD